MFEAKKRKPIFEGRRLWVATRLKWLTNREKGPGV
jgi:hypothetical protein